MNEYQHKLHDLFQLEFFGMKLGLDNIRALLESLDRPDRKFKSIHIAGTNGKGSTSAMLAAIFTAASFKTGLYTSPHLVDFRERIRIDGAMISEHEVATFLERIWPKVEKLRATFFEVTTAMAFDHFARNNVDVAIIETGLGGRLDATNVLERPLATAITSIGLDHVQQLGPTLASIASEKAGIFKHGVPAVVNCEQSLETVFEEHAKLVGAPLSFVRNVAVPEPLSTLTPQLVGAHQQQNLKTVLATLSVSGLEVSDAAIRRGIERTSELTGIRGRLEELHLAQFEKRRIRGFMDVGHNEQALSRIREFFASERVRPIVVFGIMQDKDVDAAIQIVGSFAKQTIAVQADTKRAVPSSELSARFVSCGFPSIDAGNVLRGSEIAQEIAENGDTILISGSHYVCGEFLTSLQNGENFEPEFEVEAGEHKARRV